ncbi:MAG: hypothetical protein EOP53_20935, partial [Sphingobacteriales bacterium]
MRILLTAVVSFLLFIPSLLAQDSLQVKWESSSVKNATGKYDIVLKGQINNGWHLYAKPDATMALTGLVIIVQHETITADSIRFLSPLEDYKDPIFENSVQKIAKNNIELKLPIAASAAVPASLKIKLNYDVAQQDNFLQEEQT